MLTVAGCSIGEEADAIDSPGRRGYGFGVAVARELDGANSPFSHARVGRSLATADGPKLCVWRGLGGQQPSWVHRVAQPREPGGQRPGAAFRQPAVPLGVSVVGVRVRGRRVYALDDRGTLNCFGDNGELLTHVECRVAAHSLEVAGNGLWAVIHARGAVLGRGPRVLRRLEQHEVSCACFGDEGTFIALGTGDGRLVVTPVEHGGARDIELGGTICDLAWAPRHGWLVARGDAVIRVDPSYRRIEPLWPGEHGAGAGWATQVAASADGRMCAFRCARGRLAVILLTSREGLAEIDFRSVLEGGEAPRGLGEIEFGSWPHLGVALGRGLCARIDLSRSSVELVGGDEAPAPDADPDRDPNRDPNRDPDPDPDPDPHAHREPPTGADATSRALVPQRIASAQILVRVDAGALAAEQARTLRERGEPLRQFVVTLSLIGFVVLLLVRLMMLVFS